MQYIQCDRLYAESKLAERLQRELVSGARVLWLVSGGSNIESTVRCMEAIPSEISDRLSVMCIDERFGPPNHPDSNWHQLLEAGFNQKQAKVLPILQAGQTEISARNYFEAVLAEASANADATIAQLGIGTDGHIAGILPHSVAATVTPTELIAGYATAQYYRLTVSTSALQRVRAAYVFAFGPDKKAPLIELEAKQLPIANQPAQLLKSLHEAYIFSDQIGVPHA